MIPIYDRNPTRKVPFITLSLIAVNFAIFFYMLFLKGTQLDLFIYKWGAVPWEIVHGKQLSLAALQQLLGYPAASVPSKSVYFSLFASLFVHDGWLHIGGNMIFLWVFGNNVEDVMGRFPYLLFYIVCGLVATLVYVAAYSGSIAPLIGASGAISGVLGAYLIMYPRAWVWTWVIIFIFPIPAFLVIGLWIVLQVVESLLPSTAGASGVAFAAHIGGVAIGLIITGIFWPVLKKRRDALLAQPALHWFRRPHRDSAPPPSDARGF
jgi:membrane associated rhomboid family serine protease